MNKKQQWALVCGRLVLITSAIAAFFMTFSVVLSYEKGSNYFEPNAVIPVVASVLVILAFALALVVAIILPKEELVSRSPFGSSMLTVLPSMIGFGVGGILLLVAYFQNRNTLFLVTAILLLGSAAYSWFSETESRSKEAVMLLGLLPALACALLIGVLYFDLSMEMNAPLKVAAQCALLPLMLYFTAELRYSLNRPLPRLYLALALGSVAAASLVVLAIPVACIMGLLTNTNCLIAALTVIGVNTTVLLKLKRYLQPIPAPENDMKETDAQ